MHDLHEHKSLESQWPEQRIFHEIKEYIKNAATETKKVTKTKSKSIKKKKAKRLKKHSIWNITDESEPEKEDIEMEEIEKMLPFSQGKEIDPFKIDYTEKSETIAKRSVDFYQKVMLGSIEYLNKQENLDLVIALYRNGNKMLWVLDQMPLMQYFAVIALRSGSVAGNNTASECGIKWTKFYVNPERNRMKEKKLNALNTIHEKILQDDLNAGKPENELKSMQICKTIIEGFGWKETLNEIFKTLKEKIKSAKANQSKSCM